ncbi:oxidoreductase [Wenzhouxiangella sp. AB-CW3]|uniref:FAD-binding oxidoreductase n=1 Tax=Wenzhouxiangella sp. AB-CW3 TaxID=2771012 RepID=UPI00168A95E8|nr:FAD-binding oxidoreductase [Wenzhouxiangella sp. AB-CW3]QOC23291.1 oxidoreductase [Wenzhouxiangella sp. AB-CW3]
MRIEDLDLGASWAAKVIANTALTPPEAREEVRELLLETVEDEHDFRAGQSVAVSVTGPHEFGQQEHVRLYTVARTPAELGPGRFTLCVKRCSFIDPYSGERFPGIASNYLCDLQQGDRLSLAGPVGLPFLIPSDPYTPLLMIGLGTGIAPFRAMLRELYEERDWQGKVMLFHGARTGLESVYSSDVNEISERAEGFSPVSVVSPRPAWGDREDLTAAIRSHRDEVWQLLGEPEVHVYIAGLHWVGEQFDQAMAEAAGSAGAWAERKQELESAGRWTSLLY